MYIPLPFPFCSQCNKKGNESFHRNCGGLLEINPDNNIVRCKKCNEKWNIWKSTYYCTCGNTFKASEVKKSVEDTIELCQLCAEELELRELAYWKRKKMATESKRTFVEKFFRGLGYISGMLFEKLVDYALQLFEAIICK